MKKHTSLIMNLLLLIIVVIELSGRFTDNIKLEYPVKPLIMIWMATYFLIFRTKKSYTVPVLLAFFFSWVGDNFLMFSDKGEIFFFAGVGGFFLAQLSYIFIFSRFYEEDRQGFLKKKPLLLIPFLLYVGLIYYILLPGLEGIMKPVILLYALSLMVMSMMALNRRGRVNPPSFRQVFAGSLLFLLSDSMIAIDRFSLEFSHAGFWIMITYISAQYLITRGLLMEKS